MWRWMLVLPVAFATTNASAAELTSIVGGWVGTGLSCSVLDDYSNERLMRVTKKTVSGYEYECAIAKSKGSGSRLVLDLICESEGESDRVQMVIDVLSKNKISVVGGFTYVRCP